MGICCNAVLQADQWSDKIRFLPGWPGLQWERTLAVLHMLCLKKNKSRGIFKNSLFYRDKEEI